MFTPGEKRTEKGTAPFMMFYYSKSGINNHKERCPLFYGLQVLNPNNE
jgi:hypothetical protein